MSPRTPRLRALLLATALPLALFASPLSAQEEEKPVKIAVVDLDRVVFQSASGKELQARLERLEAETRDEIKRRNEEVNEMRQKLLDQQGSLSEEEFKATQQSIEDAVIAVRRLQDDKKREASKIQESALKQIEKQLKPVFESIRDEEGYDLILNNAPGVVVMVRGSVDITDRIIERLNSMGTSSGN